MSDLLFVLHHVWVVAAGEGAKGLLEPGFGAAAARVPTRRGLVWQTSFAFGLPVGCRGRPRGFGFGTALVGAAPCAQLRVARAVDRHAATGGGALALRIVLQQPQPARDVRRERAHAGERAALLGHRRFVAARKILQIGCQPTSTSDSRKA